MASQSDRTREWLAENGYNGSYQNDFYCEMLSDFARESIEEFIRRVEVNGRYPFPSIVMKEVFREMFGEEGK